MFEIRIAELVHDIHIAEADHLAPADRAAKIAAAEARKATARSPG